MFFGNKINRIMVFMYFVLIISNGYAQQLISVKTYEDEITGTSDIAALKIVYSTTDHKGDETVASGLLLIPKIPELESAPFAVYEHGTIFQRNRVPSRLWQVGEAEYFALNNYITIAPDYLGLGESPGLHPYMHSETEASATLDMIRAVRRYFKDSLNTVIRNDIYLTGYSQGGHAAMATLKYIEENNLNDEFRINAAAPCSGPYSLSGVMLDFILYAKEIQHSDVETIVNNIISYQYVYENLYKRTKDIFKEPYDSIIDSYIENDRGFDLSSYLPVDLSKFIHDSIFVNFKNDPDHPFKQDLRKNDVHNWKPETPLKMYYSTADELVPYQNALVALSEMQKNGAKEVEAVEVSTTLNHGATAVPAKQLVLKWFNDIESGRSQSIHKTDNKTNRGGMSLTLFPNPANDDLFVNVNANGNDAIQTRIFDLNGGLIYAFPVQKIKNNPTLHYNVGGLLTAKRFYIINVRCNDYQINARFLAHN